MPRISFDKLFLRNTFMVLNLMLAIAAGEIYQVFGATSLQSSMKYAMTSNNADYPWSLILSFSICAWYIVEFVFFLDMKNKKQDRAIAVHHILTPLLVACSVKFRILVIASLCFFLADMSSLPIFALNWRGHVGKTLVVVINYTFWRTQFNLVLIHLFMELWRSDKFPLSDPAVPSFCLLILLMIMYSSFFLFKLWKIAFKTLVKQFKDRNNEITTTNKHQDDSTASSGTVM